MRIEKFEDLKVWQAAVACTKLIYDISNTKQFSRDFGLRDQIRRAIVSVSSNIVEGFEKNSNNEFIRFLRIAKGSVGEARNQLYLAFIVKHISKEEFDSINQSLEDLARQLGRFINYLVEQRKAGQFVKSR